MIEFGNLVWPLAPSVLYPHVLLNKASPKTISRRTSYLRVRLEFLRYPQVIPGFFNRRGCGPPRCLTTASACSWIGHPVSGLMPATSCALFRLALATAPELQFLNLAANINSPDRSTKSTRSHFNVLSVLVSTRFQVLFHSPHRGSFRLSFTVLVHYRSIRSI